MHSKIKKFTFFSSSTTDFDGKLIDCEIETEENGIFIMKLEYFNTMIDVEFLFLIEDSTMISTGKEWRILLEILANKMRFMHKVRLRILE